MGVPKTPKCSNSTRHPNSSRELNLHLPLNPKITIGGPLNNRGDPNTWVGLKNQRDPAIPQRDPGIQVTPPHPQRDPGIQVSQRDPGVPARDPGIPQRDPGVQLPPFTTRGTQASRCPGLPKGPKCPLEGPRHPGAIHQLPKEPRCAPRDPGVPQWDPGSPLSQTDPGIPQRDPGIQVSQRDPGVRLTFILKAFLPPFMALSSKENSFSRMMALLSLSPV